MKLKITRTDGTEEELEVSAFENLDAVEPQEAAVDVDFIPLREKAVRKDGLADIKIIQAGWGSSGYYPADMLKRDGPSIFKSGTKMYWDHPTASEEAERPERSLRDLAAELTSPARWQENGAQGPGLYASAKVFDRYAPVVDQLAPHIGVSIRALGLGKKGEAEGRKGDIIEKLVSARSIDFVTEPGAGGAVMTLFESARGNTPREEPTTVDEREAQALREAVSSFETQLKAALETLKTTEADRDRLREGQTMAEAKGLVATQVNAATLPDVTKARLIDRLSANPPVKDNSLDKDVLKSAVEAAINDETDYLAKVTGSPVRGMNSGAVTESADADAAKKRLEASFIAMGLTESAAKIAAAGRV